MKRIVIIVVLLIISTTANAQWYSETDPVSWYLYGVHFINADTGWATGDTGTILKTTDGGSTWNKQTSFVSYSSLKCIYFVDANHGWAAGKYGAITRTTDGGATWAPDTSSVTNMKL